MNIHEYRAQIGNKKKKRNKFGNKLLQTQDGNFASEWEYEYWGQLKLLQRAGEIKNLERQKPYIINVNGIQVAKYIADFVYEDKSGNIVVVDTKSKATEKLSEFRIKKNLMLAVFGINVQVILKNQTMANIKNAVSQFSKKYILSNGIQTVSSGIDKNEECLFVGVNNLQQNKGKLPLTFLGYRIVYRESVVVVTPDKKKPENR